MKTLSPGGSVLPVLPVLAAAILALSAPAAAQVHWEVEGAGGYTIVDIDAVSSADGAIATDWGQPAFRVGGRALFERGANARLGAELGYQHLYWYSVRVPYGEQPIYYDSSVSVVTAAAIARWTSDRLLLESGGGLAVGDETVPFGTASIGVMVTPSVSLKLRMDAVLFDEPAVPVGFAIGYAFSPTGG